MIKSMTGFGAGDAETADFKVHIEVKAVNQRFLETNYHMPYSMNMFENQLTKKIKEYASRGKLDINIRFQDLRDKAVTVKVDKGLVAAYGQALQEISSQLELSAPVTAAQIASYPDVLKLNEENADLEAAQPVLMQAMEQALASFVAMREAEGQNIQRDLLARIGTLENFVGELEKLAPEIVATYRQRLENLLREYLAKEDIEESRIIQEVALFTDKVNYTEETVRLRSHFDQFRQIITAGEPVGRKLDFLIQEMNREINTVASKANSAGAAQFVVDVKSEIEKIREQIQQVNQELESLRAAANTDYSVDDENVKDILDEAEVDLDNIKSCISSVEDALEELQELKESRESLDDDFEKQEEERQRRYREEEEREEFENYIAYQNRYFKF